MSHPGAVVIGGYVNAVGALRGLAREGVRTAVVLTADHDVAQYSRYAHEAHRVHYLDRRPDGLIELLQSQCLQWRNWALIPTDDYALAALAQYRDILSRAYRVTVPAAEITPRVLHKALTYQIAREVGVDVPVSYGPASRQTAARLDLKFPLVVMPQSARFGEVFGKKLLVIQDRAELFAAVAMVEDAGVGAEVFDLVPGSDDQVYSYTAYLDRWGKPVAEFGVRKLRQAPRFFGAGRAAVPADLPQLREQTIALLRRMEWTGVASVEYKLDPRDGRYRLLGVNGRCPLINALPTRCGVNYPLLAWQEHVLREKVSAVPNGWSGVWTHLHADLLHTAVEERGPDWSWRSFVRSYTGPWVDAVWSSKDPVPFLMQCAGTLRKMARGVRNPELGDDGRNRFQSTPAGMSGTYRASAASVSNQA
jgi:D-aspartate ligase